MEDEPRTLGGRLIRAAARRDNDSFNLWRADLNLTEEAQEPFVDLVFEVFARLVLRRFQSLANAGEVADFVHRERLLIWPRTGFSHDHAEKLIRSVLGERGRLAEISTAEKMTIRVQVITYLVEDMSLNDEQLLQLIANGEKAVADG